MSSINCNFETDIIKYGEFIGSITELQHHACNQLTTLYTTVQSVTDRMESVLEDFLPELTARSVNYPNSDKKFVTTRVAELFAPHGDYDRTAPIETISGVEFLYSNPNIELDSCPTAILVVDFTNTTQLRLKLPVTLWNLSHSETVDQMEWEAQFLKWVLPKVDRIIPRVPPQNLDLILLAQLAAKYNLVVTPAQ